MKREDTNWQCTDWKRGYHCRLCVQQKLKMECYEQLYVKFEVLDEMDRLKNTQTQTQYMQHEIGNLNRLTTFKGTEFIIVTSLKKKKIQTQMISVENFTKYLKKKWTTTTKFHSVQSPVKNVEEKGTIHTSVYEVSDTLILKTKTLQ